MRKEKKLVTKRQNLGQAVGEELLSLIRSGEWIPGDKLPSEQLLMQRFGVGRNALREGIHGLIRIGVLDVRPGVGTTVLSIEGSEVLEGDALRQQRLCWDEEDEDVIVKAVGRRQP